MASDAERELRLALEEIERLLGQAAAPDPWVAELARELRSLERERLTALLRRIRSDPAALRAAKNVAGGEAARLLRD
jgi:hypothetical protein